jgi:hypothetical protein
VSFWAQKSFKITFKSPKSKTHHLPLRNKRGDGADWGEIKKLKGTLEPRVTSQKKKKKRYKNLRTYSSTDKNTPSPQTKRGQICPVEWPAADDHRSPAGSPHGQKTYLELAVTFRSLLIFEEVGR